MGCIWNTPSGKLNLKSVLLYLFYTSFLLCCLKKDNSKAWLYFTMLYKACMFLYPPQKCKLKLLTNYGMHVLSIFSSYRFYSHVFNATSLTCNFTIWKTSNKNDITLNWQGNNLYISLSYWDKTEVPLSEHLRWILYLLYPMSPTSLLRRYNNRQTQIFYHQSKAIFFKYNKLTLWWQILSSALPFFSHVYAIFCLWREIWQSTSFQTLGYQALV